MKFLKFFSCSSLLDRWTILESSVTSLENSLNDIEKQGNQFNQTAVECREKSTQEISQNERQIWLKMSEKYLKIAENYWNFFDENQKILTDLKDEIYEIEVEIGNQNCQVLAKSTVAPSEGSTGIETTPSTSQQTETTISMMTAPSTEQITSNPLGFDLEGSVDFGWILKITLGILEEMVDESFSGMSYQQIFTSIFTGMEC